jgi:AhpD family alkylhydroperoxidase
MTRIAATSRRGLRGKLVLFFTRRQFAKLTGRDPENSVEPLEVYAHLPGLLRSYGDLEQATAKLHRLDWRLQVLAELRASTLIHCEWCIDLASQIARHSGLTDEQLLALPRYRDSALFTDVEKLVMDYATAMTRTPANVPDSLFAELHKHLDDGQLVELTYHIALENLRGRFNVAFDIGPAGFSEGMVCAVPTFSARPTRSRATPYNLAPPSTRATPVARPTATRGLTARCRVERLSD